MASPKQNHDRRRQAVEGSSRIVVKVGSRLLTDMADTPKQVRIEQLIRQLAAARNRGFEVVLVSSGAIAAGMMLTQAAKRPSHLPLLQGLAAIGQSRLMSLYETACQQHGFHCAQILLSWDDVKDRQRHLNVRNCINALLSNGHLPIINENDVVSVDEIRFGDNDRLAALVGTMIRADMTVLLTTMDGLYAREGGELTERISLVEGITPALRGMAAGTDGNPFSTGGMATKLDAAELVNEAGEWLWIADGSDFAVLDLILNAEDVGTLFVPPAGQLAGAKRWLAFFADPAGIVVIDKGAVQALRGRGRSLLASGIVAVEGDFGKGDTVRIQDEAGVPVAMGISNYTALELDRIKGQKSTRFKEILGECLYDEAVHRNNLVLVEANRGE